MAYQDNTYNQSRQSSIWYFSPKYIGIFLIFYQYFEYDLRKIILVLILRQKKNCIEFAFCGCHSLVSVWFRFVTFLKMTSPVPSLRGGPIYRAREETRHAVATPGNI